jgi:transglutaminase-like putative cysteine protease
VSATTLRRTEAPAPRPPRAPKAAPLLEPLAARTVTGAALGVFGGLAWGTLLEPGKGWSVVLAVAVGVAGGVGFELARALPRGPRSVAWVAALVATLALATLAAGIPLRFVVPSGWADLGDGVSTAVSSLPGVRVPYRGIDEWISWTILLGGTLLAALGCFAAVAAPRWLAAIPLTLLYAVPAVERTPNAQFGLGALFALLLLAFLVLDRLPRRAALGAAGLALVGVSAGMVVALALDRDHPPIDYEKLAESFQQQALPSFDWRHTYGPMTWTRDGREVLRVRARRAAYWKAENLDAFDGFRWTSSRLYSRAADDSEVPPGAFRPEWEQTIRVRITGMRTPNIIGAGTTLAVLRTPRPAGPGTSPGTFVVNRDLGRGDAYLARVHVPDPSAEELDAAGIDYPESMAPYTTLPLPLPNARRSARADVTYPFFGLPASVKPLTIDVTGFVSRAGGEVTDSGPYRRAYALARRLKAQSSTPYDYVRRVEAYFGRGFVYTESPPERAVPLDAFLFRDHAGYCQQFSGAMALLLRMGGVPARVSAGFAPGTLDKKRGEYVVTDLDAHSWVEAWFPKYGWVPFDPTPADTPASSTVVQASAPSAAATGDVASEPADRAPRAAASDNQGHASHLWLLALLGVPLLVIGAGIVAVQRSASRPLVYEGADRAVAELERALARTGRPLPPDTTLRELERRFDGTEAAAYVRALRMGRYGWDDRPPTRAERRALRRELGDGLGFGGRLRAVWALPPRAVRRRL